MVRNVIESVNFGDSLSLAITWSKVIA